jgi:uncharacterized alpha-E superfamily protein
MLSRMAEALYWMSRYLERAGDTARLLDINLLHQLEAEDVISEAAQWKPLLNITSSEQGFRQCHEDGEITAARVLQFMTQEASNPNAIRSSLRLARENARVVRDRISKEMWQAMNDLWLTVDRQLSRPLSTERAAAIYAGVRNGVARFHGLTFGTMMRGPAFGFYLLGLSLERTDMAARILDVKYHLLLPDLSLVGSPLDYYQWAALLKSLSGFEAYRRRYRTGLRPIDVAAFLLFEPDFPRSIRFSVEHMLRALDIVAQEGGPSASREAARDLLGHLDAHTPATVFQTGLHEFLEDILDRVAAINAALAADFFEAYADSREVRD